MSADTMRGIAQMTEHDCEVEKLKRRIAELEAEVTALRAEPDDSVIGLLLSDQALSQELRDSLRAMWRFTKQATSELTARGCATCAHHHVAEFSGCLHQVWFWNEDGDNPYPQTVSGCSEWEAVDA